MLVLGRRVGESILIGDSVEVRVVDASAARVKLGIVAPRELPIRRAELRMAAEQNRAAAAAPVLPGVVAEVVGRLRQTYPTSSP